MANQQNSYTGSEGTNTNNADFPFTFPSFTTSEVKVEVDNVVKTLTTHYTVEDYNTTSGGKVRFTTGNIPTGTTPLRIFRQTDVDNSKATFTAGASLKAGEINDNFKQVRHALQEAIGANTTDRKVQTFNIEDDAVTADKLADLSVSNANVTANAAIDGTKINPDFGSQNITTTGTATVKDLHVLHYSPAVRLVENLNTGAVIGVAQIQLNNDFLNFQMKGDASSANESLGYNDYDYVTFWDTQSGTSQIDIKRPVKVKHWDGSSFTETAAIDTATGNISTTGTVRFANLTTTERDASYGGTGIDGSVIFNTTTSKLQVKVGSNWIDLH